MPFEAFALAALLGVAAISVLERLSRGIERIGGELSRLRGIEEDRDR